MFKSMFKHTRVSIRNLIKVCIKKLWFTWRNRLNWLHSKRDFFANEFYGKQYLNKQKLSYQNICFCATHSLNTKPIRDIKLLIWDWINRRNRHYHTYPNELDNICQLIYHLYSIQMANNPMNSSIGNIIAVQLP